LLVGVPAVSVSASAPSWNGAASLECSLFFDVSGHHT